MGTDNHKLSACRIAGTIVAISVLLIGILMGGGAETFINPAAAFITFVMTAGLMMATFDSDFPRFLRASLRCLCCKPSSPNPRFVRMARTGMRYSLASGFLGTLVGCIQMLRSMDDPSNIGLGLSTALVTVFYAVILVLLFIHVATSFSPDAQDANPDPESSLP